jgi:hypothetical protein
MGYAGDLANAVQFSKPLRRRKGLQPKTFLALQTRIWEAGTWFWPRAAFTRLVVSLKASRFTAGLLMGAMIKLKPVSNGLFFRLQPPRQ